MQLCCASPPPPPLASLLAILLGLHASLTQRLSFQAHSSGMVFDVSQRREAPAPARPRARDCAGRFASRRNRSTGKRPKDAKLPKDTHHSRSHSFSRLISFFSLSLSFAFARGPKFARRCAQRVGAHCHPLTCRLTCRRSCPRPSKCSTPKRPSPPNSGAP